MKHFVIGASAAALIAIPAWAIGDKDHMDMRGPQTRAEAAAKVKDHFAKVDANKDGAITREETEAFKTAHGAAMRDKRFAALDSDKNGQISRQEFDARHGDRKDYGMDRGHRGHHGGIGMMGGRMFAKADANNDGKVTLAEATGKALEAFDRADANKDGTVTPEERRTGWQKWKEERQGKKNPAA